MQGYEVKIKIASMELSAKQRIMFKDTTDAEKLDALTTGGKSVTIKPIGYVVLDVHNEKAEKEKDYEQYLIISADGTKYTTGSEAFFSTFKGIFDEMENEAEDWELKIYQQASKNYTGKSFITCSII